MNKEDLEALSYINFNLRVKNGHSGDEWQWLANDDELNHVPEDEAGVFDAKDLAFTILYITAYGDGSSEFFVRPSYKKKGN